jgi:hypothetical protein
MSEGPAPARGDPYEEDGEWDEEDQACEGCCEDEFCGANCEMEAPHLGSHLCNYHEWTRAGYPTLGGG